MSEQIDWLRSMALMAQSAGVQVQIAADDDGKLYAVLQGDYEGALTTVKLDSDGRISAFVIDSSDVWGQILEVGNAELAARLGSPVSYDRRGQVISLTDFSQGWGIWRTLATGDDATIVLDPTTFYSGGYAVKCTGVEPDASSAYLFTRIPVLPVRTVGISVFFAIPGTAKELDLVIQYDDTVNRPQGRCRYDLTTGVLDIVNSAGAWVEVADSITIDNNKETFNYMKLVIDGDNDTYVRMLFNDQEIDLSAYATQTLATVDYSHLYLGVWAFFRAGEADVFHLDCPVITINEPT